MSEEEYEEEDNSFIKLVNRTHPMFSNRNATFTYAKDGKLVTEKIASIPDSVILCDGCNSLITDDVVGLYMLAPNHPWGTQCKSCREEYFSEVPVVDETN